jgi:hypothetical protein
MRDISAGLDGKKKIRRNQALPFFQRLLLRQVIESVIDFNGIEFCCIVIKPVAF